MISICLKNNEKIADIESEIFAEHFGVPGHKYIYMAIIYLYSKQVKPTPLSIIEVLHNEAARKAVEELGGLEYLTILEESFMPVDNLKLFIEKIKQSYTRRMLLNIVGDVKDFVLSNRAEVLNPSELVGYVEGKIVDLSANMTSNNKVYKMGSLTESILAERASSPAQIPGLEVGWTQYDRYTNGAQPGDLIIVCAPSKTGKSVTLTNWATNLGIKDQVPILYIDTEMNEREQEDRILANLSNIPYDEVISGLYVIDTVNGTAKEKIERIKKAKEMLQQGHYYHIYLPHFDINKVISLTRKFQLQFGISALFFDYIKIPSNNANFKQMQEYQALGFFTSGLKDLAGLLKLPVFTACQTNRSNTDNSPPDESDIGGSYRILQLATKLIFLKNKSAEQIAKDGFINGNQQLWIKFQRNGMSDCPPININFTKELLKQQEA